MEEVSGEGDSLTSAERNGQVNPLLGASVVPVKPDRWADTKPQLVLLDSMIILKTSFLK